ncbi:ferredoxin-A-like [Actinidia eriantha]|uniref:ferredoxin-A-like n=1 Tax=Actinidia eriantha TaxID=165200 RepID=UPI002589619D|nr:ferredoxin-A-like [Actinidia eriantha]
MTGGSDDPLVAAQYGLGSFRSQGGPWGLDNGQGTTYKGKLITPDGTTEIDCPDDVCILDKMERGWVLTCVAYPQPNVVIETHKEE